MTRKKSICSRPTCDRAIPGNPHLMGGLCFRHAVAAGLAHHLQPADEAREIVLDALDSGWLFIDIHRATGVNQQTLYRLRDGELARVKQTTLERLRSLPEHPPARALPAGPTIQRITELREAGVTVRQIADDLGVNYSRLVNYSAGRRTTVPPELAVKVHAYHTRRMPRLRVGECAHGNCSEPGVDEVRGVGMFCVEHADEKRALLGRSLV